MLFCANCEQRILNAVYKFKLLGKMFFFCSATCRRSHIKSL